MRPAADALVESVLVLTTLGAPERRVLQRNRPRSVQSSEPEPVPTTRATVVRAAPFASESDAAEWLSGADLDEEVTGAVLLLNRALHAHRVRRERHAHRGDAGGPAALGLVAHQPVAPVRLVEEVREALPLEAVDGRGPEVVVRGPRSAHRAVG